MLNQNFWKNLLKLFCIIVMSNVFSVVVYAVPANPFPQQVNQADGTQITIQGFGDEFFNWVETSDGYVIDYDNEADNWYYAVISEGMLSPGNEVVGSNTQTSRKAMPKITRNDLEGLINNIDRSAAMPETTTPDSNMMSGDPGFIQRRIMPIEHTKNRQPLLVLLIEYNNMQFTTTTSHWSNHFFGTHSGAKTVNNYYKENSGALDLQFVKPTFTVSNGYTAANPITGVSSVAIQNGVVKVRLKKKHPNTSQLGDVVRDDIELAFDAVKQLIDFSSISAYHDSILCEDFNVTSVLAGYEASASPKKTPSIWAHASWGYYSNVNGKTKNVSIANISNSPTLNTYATQGELYNTGVAMSVGVSAHELGHVLGLQDLYSYTEGEGIGVYSLMASGCWGRTSTDQIGGMTPTHLDAWSKIRLGFANPITISSAGYQIHNVNSIANGYNILKVTSSIDADQYFVVENRQLSGFDKGLECWTGSNNGILIYHIDEKVHDGYRWNSQTGSWTGRINDNNYHKAVDLERYSVSNSNPFYVSGGSNLLNSTSIPNSNFHKAGHVDNPMTHTNCHPQNRSSGIQIKVNSSRANSMKVEVGTVSRTVTYNYSENGGVSATKTSATVNQGSAINLTPTATKSGWTFVGWNTNKNATTALSSRTMGTSNVTLYAIYQKVLTGKFIDYSETTKCTRSVSVTIYNKATNGIITTPSQYTYTGWKVRGWSTATESNATVMVSSGDSYTINANTKFYGLYQRTLTLSYNANGGSSTPSSQTGKQYVNSYSVTEFTNPAFKLNAAISRTGYTFGGWARSSTSGTKYNAGSSIFIATGTTMYAVWDKKNTTFAGATAILLNTPINVKITAANQKRYYIFTAPTAGIYTFYSSDIVSGDPCVWRYDSNQTQLTYDDNGGGMFNFTITCALLQVGQQVYIAGGCYGLGTGSYALTATKFTLPAIK